jgi:hypothetical protein
MSEAIYFDNKTAREEARKAYAAGDPIRVRVADGRFKGSVGLLPARSIAYESGSSFYLKYAGFTLDFGKKKQRFGGDSIVRYNLRGVSKKTELVCKEIPIPKPPEFLLDRHGQELRKGAPVLVAMSERFVFGVVDRLTPTALIVRNGKTRTRLEQKNGKMPGVCLLDKSLSARFMMEKLAKA